MRFLPIIDYKSIFEKRRKAGMKLTLPKKRTWFSRIVRSSTTHANFHINAYNVFLLVTFQPCRKDAFRTHKHLVWWACTDSIRSLAAMCHRQTSIVIRISVPTYRCCCVPSRIHRRDTANAFNRLTSWLSTIFANLPPNYCSPPSNGPKTYRSFPNCRSPIRWHFFGWCGLNCSFWMRHSVRCHCMWLRCWQRLVCMHHHWQPIGWWRLWTTFGSFRSR